ncbi:MAG: SDR family NAD(P)-dependent oxidoreductase [Candidatus Bathyarchaeota archaeon]|nr:SDR family NAD(P)-dependent oxidoreductase [Candidatus Bathyarchaeota archaeon]
MTRVLITGIMGFIGSHLAQRLVNDGAEVYGVVRRVANRNLDVISNIIRDVTLVSGDVSDYVSVRNAVKTVNPDVIFHLAALSPVRDSFERPFEYQQANYIGTMNVAHSMLELQDPQTRKLIAASTAEVYGIQASEPLKETLPLHPSSPYAASKAAGDLYLQMMFNSFSLKGTVLRPANSYGRKFDASFMVEYLVTKMLAGEKIYIGAPDSVRDYMYVDDHVNGYVLAMKNPAANGQVYNVGTTIGVSNRELALMLAGKIGFNPKNIALGSYPPGYPYRPLVSDQSSIVLDSAKIRQQLGWQPTVSLSDGLDRVIGYFKAKRPK